MTKPRKAGSGLPGLRFAVLSVLSAALLYGAWSYAYYAVFSAFMQYDDEGYLLITQKMFFEGHPLYDRVYTQYGPFYYLYYWVLWAAGIAGPTHDSGRFVTIAHWLAASAGFGWLALRVTGRYWAASLAFLASVLHLTPLRFEPSHTQGLVIALIGVFAIILTLQRGARVADILAVALGTIAGVMAATKINTGVLMYLAFICGGWATLDSSHQLRWPHAHRTLTVLLGAGAAAFPLVLMRQNLPGNSWAWHYCIAATTSIIAFLVLTLSGDVKQRNVSTTLRSGFAMHAAVVAGIAGSVAFAIHHGSTMGAMWEHLVTRALAFPTVFKEPPNAFTLTTSVCAVIALANAIAWHVFQNRVPDVMANAMPGTKIIVACAFFVLSISVDRDAATAWLAPWLWLIVAIEPRREEAVRSTYWARLMLGCLSGFMLLYAYPVFATQGTIATALLVPLFAIVLYDGIVETGMLLQPSPLIDAARRVGVVVLTSACIAIYAVVAEYQDFRRIYFDNEPLDLPGTKHVRLRRALATEIHWLVENLRVHADTFVSLPGMNSFYLWAQLEPPTPFNAGSWSFLLDEARQKEIIRAIQDRENVCAIVSPQFEQLWYVGREPLRTVLVEYIDDKFQPLAESVHYSFRVRKERDHASLYIALLNEPRTFGSNTPALAMPQDLVPANAPFTFELQFCARGVGALVGTQTRDHPVTPVHLGWRPLLYIGFDGRLRTGPLEGGASVVVSDQPVTDGAVHHAAIVVTDSEWQMYLDGHHCGTGPVPEDVTDERFWQLGDAFTTGFPEAPDGWFPFHGTISNVKLWHRARTKDEIAASAGEVPAPADAK